MVLAGGRGSRGSQLYRRTASTGKLSGLFPAPRPAPPVIRGPPAETAAVRLAAFSQPA
jgi:hypothetical protein